VVSQFAEPGLRLGLGDAPAHPGVVHAAGEREIGSDAEPVVRGGAGHVVRATGQAGDRGEDPAGDERGEPEVGTAAGGVREAPEPGAGRCRGLDGGDLDCCGGLTLGCGSLEDLRCTAARQGAPSGRALPADPPGGGPPGGATAAQDARGAASAGGHQRRDRTVTTRPGATKHRTPRVATRAACEEHGAAAGEGMGGDRTRRRRGEAASGDGGRVHGRADGGRAVARQRRGDLVDDGPVARQAQVPDTADQHVAGGEIGMVAAARAGG
jgi:hypothetical protein